MLFSNSPLKKVAEKLNPFSQKNKISRLKFERKNDYRTFLKFIKDSTKEIENIKISDPEDKKRKGLMLGGGILGLALLGSFGKGERDSDDSAGKLKSIAGVIEKSKADAKRAVSGDKKRRNLDTTSDLIKLSRKKIGKKFSPNIPEKVNLSKSKIDTDKLLKNKSEVENPKKIQRDQQAKSRTTTEVGGNTTKKSTSATATIDDFINADDPFDPKPKQSSNQGKQGPTGGTRGRSGGKDKLTNQDLKNLQSDLGAEEQIKEAKKIKLQDKLKIKSDIRKDRQEKGDRALKVLDDLEAESKRRAAIEDAEIKKTKSKKIKGPRSPVKNYGGGMGFKEDFGTTRIGKVRPKPGFIIDPLTNEVIPDPKRKMKVDRSKFFKAPEIPNKTTTKKLNNFDKFNRFSNRTLNSPVGKFTTFFGGLLANPKLKILQTLMEPTPLADGTLEGKPGVGVNSEKFMFDEDMAVNIFMPPEGRESMIPFSADVELPSVSTPTSLQSPDNKIVVDYESSSSEDLFFIKMAGL